MCKAKEEAKATEEVKSTVVITKATLELKGVKKLRVEKIEKKIIVTNEIDPNTKVWRGLISKREEIKVLEEESEEFELKETTQKELAIYRKLQEPCFVLTIKGTSYFSPVPRELNLISSHMLGPHKCTTLDSTCSRFSAASDSKGGCEKVRHKSAGIERYPWIINGYETFATATEAFLVTECLHCCHK